MRSPGAASAASSLRTRGTGTTRSRRVTRRTCSRRRSSTSCRSAGQDVREHRQRGRERADRRLAAQHHLQVPVWRRRCISGRASATCPDSSAPAASRRSSTRTRCSHRTRAASIRPTGPLFNKDAFEPVNAFNYYFGRGNRVEETIRGFAYQNQDLTLMKNTRMAGGTNLQLRFEVFNMWNWHTFQRRWPSGAIRRSTTTFPAANFGDVEWRGDTEPRIDAAGYPLRVLGRISGRHGRRAPRRGAAPFVSGAMGVLLDASACPSSCFLIAPAGRAQDLAPALAAASRRSRRPQGQAAGWGRSGVPRPAGRRRESSLRASQPRDRRGSSQSVTTRLRKIHADAGRWDEAAREVDRRWPWCRTVPPRSPSRLDRCGERASAEGQLQHAPITHARRLRPDAGGRRAHRRGAASSSRWRRCRRTPPATARMRCWRISAVRRRAEIDARDERPATGRAPRRCSSRRSNARRSPPTC